MFGTITSALSALKDPAQALGALGGLFGGNSNAAIGEQMRWQQEWQSEMRQTAWQATVPDMIKAGINPMAAFGSGANNTPGQGGMQAPINTRLQKAQAAALTSSAVQNMTQNKLTEAQTEAAQAQAANIRADTSLKMTSALNMEQQTTNLKGAFEKMQYEMKQIVEDTELTRRLQISETQRTGLIDAQENLARISAMLEAGKMDYTEAQTQTEKIRQQMMRLEIPALKNMADWENTMGTGEGNVVTGIGKIINVIRSVVKR